MPSTPPKPCLTPGCPNLVPYGRCLQCQQARPVAPRASAARRGYDRTWRRLRLIVLHEEPLCRLCGAPAEHVDHVVPLGRGGTNDRSNLQALCHPCHSRKTDLEDGGFGRPATRSEAPPGGSSSS